MSEAVAGAEYVVGFMFDEAERDVLLIRKTHPEWQTGKLNGVGGRIEDGETPLEAMCREFKEEVGIEHPHWREFCILSDTRDWSIHFFSAVGPIWDAMPMGDERPEIVRVGEIPDFAIPNLRWLIPMALTMKNERADCFVVLEQKNG